MNKYFISYGLGGGFGGADTFEVLEFDNIDQASSYAWNKSVEEYEGHVGNHGLRTREEIMEEDDIDEIYATQEYVDERESWLDYNVELYDEELHNNYL